MLIKILPMFIQRRWVDPAGCDSRRPESFIRFGQSDFGVTHDRNQNQEIID